MWAEDSEVATRQAVEMASRIYFPCYFTKIGLCDVKTHDIFQVVVAVCILVLQLPSFGSDDPYGQSKDDATSSCSNKLCKKPAYVGTSDHFTIVVADLSPDANDDLLYDFFSVFPSCSGARVMLDHKTGQSTEFGFVSFHNQKDARAAINDFSGKWLCNRRIWCKWATTIAEQVWYEQPTQK